MKISLPLPPGCAAEPASGSEGPHAQVMGLMSHLTRVMNVFGYLEPRAESQTPENQD
jgi:hypothetical protein